MFNDKNQHEVMLVEIKFGVYWVWWYHIWWWHKSQTFTEKSATKNHLDQACCTLITERMTCFLLYRLLKLVPTFRTRPKSFSHCPVLFLNFDPLPTVRFTPTPLIKILKCIYLLYFTFSSRRMFCCVYQVLWNPGMLQTKDHKENLNHLMYLHPVYSM